MDRTGSDTRSTAADVTAAAVPPSVPAARTEHGTQAEPVTSFYERGDVRIRYQEIGSGFPLLVIPGGGLNSRIANWRIAPYGVFDPMEEFKNDFRCITMDHRNANGGESTGPVPVDDPWGAFADDHLGLMDHLGIDRFFFLGCCIGGPFVFKAIERAPDRVVAAVICQTVGHRPEKPDHMYEGGRDRWAKEFRVRHPEVSMETVERYLHNLYRVRPDFVYSVSREFVRHCPTPMLVMPDDTPGHPYQVSMDIAALAPNVEVTVYPWKEPPEAKAQALDQVRAFLKAHLP
jgi:pimeloyl-ACP methyl ester carboxylesterase